MTHTNLQASEEEKQFLLDHTAAGLEHRQKENQGPEAFQSWRSLEYLTRLTQWVGQPAGFTLQPVQPTDCVASSRQLLKMFSDFIFLKKAMVLFYKESHEWTGPLLPTTNTLQTLNLGCPFV